MILPVNFAQQILRNMNFDSESQLKTSEKKNDQRDQFHRYFQFFFWSISLTDMRKRYNFR